MVITSVTIELGVLICEDDKNYRIAMSYNEEKSILKLGIYCLETKKFLEKNDVMYKKIENHLSTLYIKNKCN